MSLKPINRPLPTMLVLEYRYSSIRSDERRREATRWRHGYYTKRSRPGSDLHRLCPYRSGRLVDRRKHQKHPCSQATPSRLAQARLRILVHACNHGGGQWLKCKIGGLGTLCGLGALLQDGSPELNYRK